MGATGRVMTDILAQMEAYRDAVNAADVRCVLDARDVNPPCLLIRPPTMNFRFGRGCISATWAAWLYLPDAGQINAVRMGVPMLTQIQDALSTVGVAILSATPTDFQPPDGGIVPGFILNWNTSQ